MNDYDKPRLLNKGDQYKGDGIRPVDPPRHLWYIDMHGRRNLMDDPGSGMYEGKFWVTMHLVNPYCEWPNSIEVLFLPKDLVVQKELSMRITRIDTELCDNTWYFDPDMTRLALIHKKTEGDREGEPLYLFTDKPVPGEALSFFILVEEPPQGERTRDPAIGVDPEAVEPEFRSFTHATLYLRQVEP